MGMFGVMESTDFYFNSTTGVNMTHPISCGFIIAEFSEIEYTPLERWMMKATPKYVRFLDAFVGVLFCLMFWVVFGLFLIQFAALFQPIVNHGLVGVSMGVMIIYGMMFTPFVFVLTSKFCKAIWRRNHKKKFFKNVQQAD